MLTLVVSVRMRQNGNGIRRGQGSRLEQLAANEGVDESTLTRVEFSRDDDTKRRTGFQHGVGT